MISREELHQRHNKGLIKLTCDSVVGLLSPFQVWLDVPRKIVSERSQNSFCLKKDFVWKEYVGFYRGSSVAKTIDRRFNILSIFLHDILNPICTYSTVSFVCE